MQIELPELDGGMRAKLISIDKAAAICDLHDGDGAPVELGEAFIDHYVISREVEWKLGQRWLAKTVTPWELDRYSETI
jgi:glutamine synthetase